MPDNASTTGRRDDPRLRTLLDRAWRIGPLIDQRIAIAGTGRSVTVTRPAFIDELLEHVAGDPEQNLPYWAEIWPSGIALAAAIAREPERVRGLPVLELGCGAGLTAAVALEAGAGLVATDYAEESLLLTRLNSHRHTGREPVTERINWRAPLPASLPVPTGGFPVVLAADVLYERRDVAPLLDLAPRIVAPSGILWLAEPGRPPAAAFLEAIGDAGWTVDTTTDDGPWPDPADANVTVRLHVLRRPAEPGP